MPFVKCCKVHFIENIHTSKISELHLNKFKTAYFHCIVLHKVTVLCRLVSLCLNEHMDKNRCYIPHINDPSLTTVWLND